MFNNAATYRSADPPDTYSPSYDQELFSNSFSAPWCTPDRTCSQRSLSSPATNGRTFHIRREQSIELDTSRLPSGLTDRPVTVSEWPSKTKSGVSRLPTRVSKRLQPHTQSVGERNINAKSSTESMQTYRMMLSTPAVKRKFPSGLNDTAHTW